MSYLRKLCCAFYILPSSFVVTPKFGKRGAAPFATGGFSDVYKASLGRRHVAVKVLKVNTQTVKKAHRVSASLPPPQKGVAHTRHKLLVKEVVGWKWVRHENILPFVGVSQKPPFSSIVSEWMENGNIMNFIKVHQNHNRLHLVSEGRVCSPIILTV